MIELENKKFSFNDFIWESSKSWFGTKEGASVWVRFYNNIGLPSDIFTERYKEMGGILDLEVPVFLQFANIEWLRIPQLSQKMYSDELGNIKIALFVDNKEGEEGKHLELPKGNYVFMLSPYKKTDEKTNELLTKKTFDYLASILLIHCGKYIAYNKIADTIFDLEKGDFSVQGDWIARPMPIEGFGRSDFKERSHELILAIKNISDNNKKNRIDASFRLIAKAHQENDYFLSYWVALEVVCGGKSKTINKKLQDIYKEDESFINDTLKLKWLTDTRNAFFHDGKQPHISKELERYFQLLYLDLLRNELGLEPIYGLRSMIENNNCDLSMLGI